MHHCLSTKCNLFKVCLFGELVGGLISDSSFQIHKGAISSHMWIMCPATLLNSFLNSRSFFLWVVKDGLAVSRSANMDDTAFLFTIQMPVSTLACETMLDKGHYPRGIVSSIVSHIPEERFPASFDMLQNNSP